MREQHEWDRKSRNENETLRRKRRWEYENKTTEWKSVRKNIIKLAGSGGGAAAAAAATSPLLL